MERDEKEVVFLMKCNAILSETASFEDIQSKFQRLYYESPLVCCCWSRVCDRLQIQDEAQRYDLLHDLLSQLVRRNFVARCISEITSIGGYLRSAFRNTWFRQRSSAQKVMTLELDGQVIDSNCLEPSEEYDLTYRVEDGRVIEVTALKVHEAIGKLDNASMSYMKLRMAGYTIKECGEALGVGERRARTLHETAHHELKEILVRDFLV